MAEMTLEQQQAMALAAARLRLKQNQQPQSTGMDMLKSAGSGIAQGALDLVGLPGTIQNAFDQSFSKVTGDVASLWGGKGVPAPPPSPLSGEGLRDLVSQASGGATEYKAQTTPGRYTQTAASFIPGSLLGPGSVAGKVGTGLLSGVTSEGAGQLAENYAPSLEPYARIAGALVGGLAPSAAKSLFPSAQEVGLAEVGKAAAADNLTPQQMTQNLDDLGSRSMVADLGPNLRGQAGAMANLPGRNNGIIREALDQRAEGANARINQTMDQTLGPRVVPSEIKAAVEEGQGIVGQQYGPVMANATRVNTEPLANRLDASMANLRGPERAAVERVRGFLNIPETNVLDPNPQALHSTREAIDGLLRTEQNPNVIRALTDARREVDDVLAVAAPGIKDVDAQYHELARQAGGRGDAVGGTLLEGQRVLDSGRTAPRPEDVANAMAEGALPHGNMIGPSGAAFRLRQGARADIDRIVGNNKNDIAAMARLIKGEGDWNPQKLRTLFGEERANQLMRVLDNERTFAETNNFATGNSLSANRLQYMKQYGGSAGGMNISDYYGAGGLMGAVRGVLVKGARKVAGKAMDARNEAINAEIAKNLTGREGVAAALLQQQLRGNRLVGPAKAALVQALLDQQRRQERP